MMTPGMYLKAAMAGIGIVMGLAIWFLWQANENKALTIGEQAGVIAGYEKAEQVRQEVAEVSARYSKDLQEFKNNDAKTIGALKAQLALSQLDAEDRANINPTQFGDGISVFIARVMCRVQASTDGSSRSACDSAPASSFTSKIALALTANPDLTTKWAWRCELFQDWSKLTGAEADAWQTKFGIALADADKCRWSITGFTPAGLNLVENYLLTLEAAILERDRWIENTIQRIEAVGDIARPNKDKTK